MLHRLRRPYRGPALLARPYESCRQAELALAANKLAQLENYDTRGATTDTSL